MKRAIEYVMCDANSKILKFDEWISASSTRNWIIKDPLLDWLHYHSNLLGDEYKMELQNVMSNGNDLFIPFIMNQGVEFEKYVIGDLFKKFKEEIIDIGCNKSNCMSDKKFDDTLKAMNDGIPIIYSGVVKDDNTKTYGIPDLIIRDDYLSKLVNDPPTEAIEFHISSLKCGHYYSIVDIKFSTLYLRADGIHLLNSNSLPAYKSQLYIYTRALGIMQQCSSQIAYILGKRWKYSSKNNDYSNPSCYNKLGVIDYNGVDNMYIDMTDNAIQWIRDVRQDGAKWDPLGSHPLIRSELYPNMSNDRDYPWHNIKKIMAKEIDEITSVWNCGVENRKIAHGRGVYKWTDKRCNSDILGIKGKMKIPIIDSILSINRDENYEMINPPKISNNLYEWKNKTKIEFYLDFETVNIALEGTIINPHLDTYFLIAMIGLGYVDEQGKWIYKNFTVDNLTLKDEEVICNEMNTYIKNVLTGADYKGEFSVFHWGNYEKICWANAIKQHPNISNEWFDFKFVDMLDVFRKEPIIVKGCLSFGLKEITNSMCKNSLIDVKWDQGCIDGLDAMIKLYDASKIALIRDISMKMIPVVNDIIKYNEIDCKSVYEIVKYLRNSHI